MPRFDIRTFVLIFGAALIGAAWAIYNRGLVPSLPLQGQLRAQTWLIFATPFAMFWGWFFARRAERLAAAAICFCIYFFAPFVAAPLVASGQPTLGELRVCPRAPRPHRAGAGRRRRRPGSG